MKTENEITSANQQYVLDWWNELPFERKKEIFHKEHETEDTANKYKIEESIFPMWERINK